MTRQATPARSRRSKATVHRSAGKAGVGVSPRADTLPVIRDAVIRAAIEAGEGDMVAYLKAQALTHPSAFLTLLGKVLPMQLTGCGNTPVNLRFSIRFVGSEASQDPNDNSR
jgi:hypothetical protein